MTKKKKEETPVINARQISSMRFANYKCDQLIVVPLSSEGQILDIKSDKVIGGASETTINLTILDHPSAQKKDCEIRLFTAADLITYDPYVRLTYIRSLPGLYTSFYAFLFQKVLTPEAFKHYEHEDLTEMGFVEDGLHEQKTK